MKDMTLEEKLVVLSAFTSTVLATFLSLSREIYKNDASNVPYDVLMAAANAIKMEKVLADILSKESELLKARHEKKTLDKNNIH